MNQRKDEGFLPGAHAIDAYGNGGFRFAGMSHRGSILALPSGIRAWKPSVMADIDEASLAPLFAEPSGRVDHFLIGTGTELIPLEKALERRLREAGIRPECMATAAAVFTYSMLLGEKRLVAAALLAVP
jgi:uncharacterized protein